MSDEQQTTRFSWADEPIEEEDITPKYTSESQVEENVSEDALEDLSKELNELRYKIFNLSIKKMREHEQNFEKVVEKRFHLDCYNSFINCKKWLNFSSLVTSIINMDCEIFGGAARDLIYRNHMTNLYNDYLDNETDICIKYLDSYERYDNCKVHPYSYKGRTLMPTDLDIYIQGKDKFNKLMTFLNERYKIHHFHNESPDFQNSQSPYFLETDPRFKDALEYHSVDIVSFNMSTELYRMLEFVKIFITKDIYEKIFESCKIHLDIIVLIDESMTDIRPPFNNPDFRCNQISLVKRTDGSGYEVKANWNFIDPYYINPGRFDLTKQIKSKIEKLKIESENLDIIINDILEQKAIPVITGKIPSLKRIIKMYSKNYDVHLESFIPFIIDILSLFFCNNTTLSMPTHSAT